MWIHIVISINGQMITDSLNAEYLTPVDLAKRIQNHINRGGEIVAVTSSNWMSDRQPSSDEMDAMAAEFECEGE